MDERSKTNLHVKIQEKADWLEQGKRERSNKSHYSNLSGGHIFAHQLRFALQVLVTGEDSKAPGSSVEDICRAGLWEEEYQINQAKT